MKLLDTNAADDGGGRRRRRRRQGRRAIGSSMSLCWLFLLTFLSFGPINVVKSEGICWMLYQMADNDLEYFIRQDNNELINSEYVKDPNAVTWVYFDARNYRDWFLGKNLFDPDITEPLKDIYNSDGTPYTGDPNNDGEKFLGSRYFTYDHALEKMIIDTTLEEEQNSDSPTVLYEFLVRALGDCISKGTTEFFVALSSHGTGVAGFGGDESNEDFERRLERRYGRRVSAANKRRRNLLQTNNLIVSALQLALDTVEGAPEKYDMIGFDACLMSSFEALDDFSVITKYYLASEATEPGHGWAYDKLTPQDSVIDLGKQIIDLFADELQGDVVHQTPKQLALLDTSKWLAFVEAWEALSAEFLTLLESEEEALFRQAVQRARVGSLTVIGGWFDDRESQFQGALDVGDFLSNFVDICSPDEANGSTLPELLDNAKKAYEDMFVYRRLGEGTPNLTGMHITWPLRNLPEDYMMYLDIELFNVTHPYYSAHSPFYNDFLDLYLESNAPHFAPGTACTCDAPEVEIQRDDLSFEEIDDPDFDILLLNPELLDWKEGLEIRSQVAPTTDFVEIDYGVEIYHLWKDRLDGGRRRNLLQRRLSNIVKHGRHDGSAFPDTAPDSSAAATRRIDKLRPHREARRARRMEWKYRQEQARRRHLAGEDDETELEWYEQDYFIIFGGSTFVQYSCSGITSTWDRKYFFFTTPDGIEEGAFIEDGGEGAKTAYFFYFRELSEEAIASIKEGTFTFEDVDANGGLDASLTFSVDPETGEPRQNLVLFIIDLETGGINELPPSSSGYIVPLMYVESVVDGYFIDYLVGGYYGTVIEWKEDHGVTVNIDDTKGRFFDELESPLALLDVSAYDFDKFDGNLTAGFDFFFFELEEEDLTTENKPTQNGNASAGSLTMFTWIQTFIVAGVWLVWHLI